MSKRKSIARVGIVAKPHAASPGLLKRLQQSIEEKKLRGYWERDTAALLDGAEEVYDREAIVSQVDLIIVLGGDGTLLSVARLIGEHCCPLLGVNLGGLGFLTEVTEDGFNRAIDQVIAGEYVLEPRMMLDGKVFRGGRPISHDHVLNDVVINKSALARIVDLDLSINEKFVSTFAADGLIISTPTGSTAYSLAAGGPIVHPSLEAILVTPISPHTLTNRPLIIPADAEIEVKLGSEKEEVYLTLDGQTGFALQPGDVLHVSKSANRVELIRFPQNDYFGILRRKFLWGG